MGKMHQKIISDQIKTTGGDDFERCRRETLSSLIENREDQKGLYCFRYINSSGVPCLKFGMTYAGSIGRFRTYCGDNSYNNNFNEINSILFFRIKNSRIPRIKEFIEEKELEIIKILRRIEPSILSKNRRPTESWYDTTNDH